MATKYELPEEVNEKRLRTLGKEVEMKTFKTNMTSDGRPRVRFICVGNTRKGMLIKELYQNVLTLNALNELNCDGKAEGPVDTFSIDIEFCEVTEYANYPELFKPFIFYKDKLGAIAFWRTPVLSSLKRAAEWMQDMRKFVPSIPCVLVTDNTTSDGQEPLQWIGPGRIFENEAALDQFCKDHGFVDHFEIKSLALESGENSVFKQAVIRLIVDIFTNKQKEASFLGTGNVM